jgi:hypothetical protein
VSWPSGVSMPAPGPAELDSVFEGAFPHSSPPTIVAKEYIGRSVSGPRSEHHPGRGRSRSWCGRSGVPIRWNGEVADLPAGCTDTTRRAAEGRERAEEPGTFVICGGIVSPGRTGKSLAGQLITALGGLAPGAGCQRVLALVRPTLRPKTRSRRSARSRAGPGTTAFGWIPGYAPTGGLAARSSPPRPDRRP